MQCNIVVIARSNQSLYCILDPPQSARNFSAVVGTHIEFDAVDTFSDFLKLMFGNEPRELTCY